MHACYCGNRSSGIRRVRYCQPVGGPNRYVCLKGIIRRQSRKEKLVTRQFIEEQMAALREAMKALAATLIELKVQMDRIELTIDSSRNLRK